MGKHNKGRFKPKTLLNVDNPERAPPPAPPTTTASVLSSDMLATCKPSAPFQFNPHYTAPLSVNATVAKVEQNGTFVEAHKKNSWKHFYENEDNGNGDTMAVDTVPTTPASKHSHMAADSAMDTQTVSLSTPHTLRTAATSATPRSTPRNGRTWHDPQLSEKASSMQVCKSKALTSPYAKRAALKAAFVENRNKTREIAATAKAEKQEEKRKAAQRAELKKANEKKAQVVQVITDTRKIKRMNKKQLKSIEKR